jgi:hypothetical protein
MAQRLPYKDDHDPAPYVVLGEQHRTGQDVRQAVADLIVDTRTRPGFMAKRLNLAGIPAPDGGVWTWKTVQDAKHREQHARALRVTPRDHTNMPPLPPDRSDDEDWRFEDEIAFVDLDGKPVTRGQLEAEGCSGLPDAPWERRRLWKWTHG